MKRGWVKDWRKDEDWRWHPSNMDRPYTEYEAFKDLIKLANHEERQVPYEGDYFLVKRGQRLTSQVRLAKRWKWSKTKVHRQLRNWQACDEIETQTNRRHTLITICNYDIYQNRVTPPRNPDETEMKLKRNSSGHKQELEELKELNTTTGDVVEKKIGELSDRFARFGVDPKTAALEITEYAIANDFRPEDIGKLVYRWPENDRTKSNPKTNKHKESKDYGPPGEIQI